MEPSVVVGIDLGVTAPSEVAVARGAVIEAGRRVASTPKGLTDGLRAAAKDRPVAIVVESTAMAWFVAAVAAVRAGIAHTLYRVSGTKAAALRAFYRSHTKTDHIDARVLARMPAVDDSLRSFHLPTPAELALRRLVGLRHKLGVGATKVQNQVRSMLHWAAPGLVRAAGGSVGPGLVAVLTRWPDLRDLARARVATIAATGGWAPERARAVKKAASEAAAFYEGFVDFADLALELEVAVAQLSCLKAQQARVEGRIGGEPPRRAHLGGGARQPGVPVAGPQRQRRQPGGGSRDRPVAARRPGDESPAPCPQEGRAGSATHEAARGSSRRHPALGRQGYRGRP